MYSKAAPTMLRAGTWKVVGQNFVDSKVVVNNGSAQHFLGDTFTLETISPLQADFTVRGSEKAISVLVEKVG